MAALRSCWDLPYRSHHQQLVQPRRSPEDRPGQRRSRGVQPYDQPQPPRRRVMPSRLEMPQQQTYKGRYEQLIDLLDAATSRLESRWEEIDRRITKLCASKAAYGQQLYAAFDSGVNNAAWPPPPPRRRPTCWDPPSRTHGRRIEEIRAPPLPEPPPQYTPTPSQHSSVMQSRKSTYWDPPGQRQSRGIPTHDLPYGVPPYEQPRSPPDVYTGRQRNCRTGTNTSRSKAPIHQHNRTSCSTKSHCCSSCSTSSHCQVTAAAAPPPPLKQPSTTSAIELPPYAAPRPCQPLLPLSVKAPLSPSTRQPQGGVSSSRKKELETDLHDNEKKREEKLIVLNNVWNQKKDRERE